MKEIYLARSRLTYKNVVLCLKLLQNQFKYSALVSVECLICESWAIILNPQTLFIALIYTVSICFLILWTDIGVWRQARILELLELNIDAFNSSKFLILSSDAWRFLNVVNLIIQFKSLFWFWTKCVFFSFSSDNVSIILSLANPLLSQDVGNATLKKKIYDIFFYF